MTGKVRTNPNIEGYMKRINKKKLIKGSISKQAKWKTWVHMFFIHKITWKWENMTTVTIHSVNTVTVLQVTTEKIHSTSKVAYIRSVIMASSISPVRHIEESAESAIITSTYCPSRP